MHSTLTSEISGLQVKLMYLQFKSVKINAEIERLKELEFDSSESPEFIQTRGEIAYSVIDVISLFEHYNSFVNNVKNASYPLLQKMDESLKEKLENIRELTAQWKHVRNKLGGHLDIKRIQEFCEQNNYNGVFLSNHLEADFKGALLPMMLESALNSTLEKSRLFERNLKLTDPSDMNVFIIKFNQDWAKCMELFRDFFKFLYGIGKQEKLAISNSEDIGIIKF